jgi:hypothetical protein
MGPIGYVAILMMCIRAVEAEVARRLQERERELEAEREPELDWKKEREMEKEKEAGSSR